ncbi:hypothetical protein P8452_43598 [Trifolium repens]|nr:hypothetical protein QL285_028515 [Trifolium repens]WJX58110.1 hypothetical protein P8452_43598 [Trifolium repens]
MSRFDVARIKFLLSTWASIDFVLKVEVEGLVFDLWVVEERGNQRSVAVFNGVMEDEGSHVYPAEESQEEDEVVGEDCYNIGEDEMSGEELVGKLGKKKEQCTRLDVDRDLTGGLPKEGNVILTCDKSTKIPSLEEEIHVMSVVVEENKVTEDRPGEKELELSSSVWGDVNHEKGTGGSNTLEVRETEGSLNQIETVGGASRGKDPVGDVAVPKLGVDLLIDVAGQSNPVPEPLNVGLSNSAQDGFEQQFRGVLVQEDICRYSTMSEPEEVHSSHRKKAVRSKFRQHKQSSKFPNLGVPTCVKLVEAMKEAVAKHRRRRQRGGGVRLNGVESEEEEITPAMEVSTEFSKEKEGARLPRGVTQTPTPASGLILISGSEISRVPDSQSQGHGVDKEKLIEAAKLLSIQKEVGFNFEVAEEETLKNLVEQELCDREKKMDWEKSVGDQ